MKKEYFLLVSLGGLKSRWIRVDSYVFDDFYFNNSYCMKRYSCVRHGLRHDYYTFYLQLSNGLAKLGSTVKFMILYGGSTYE